MRLTISFTLDDEHDYKIVRWLRNLPRGEKSKAIRDALDAHLSGNVTLGDVYQTVKEIERKLQSGAFSAGAGLVEPDGADDFERENPDIMDALRNLGK